MRILHVQVLYFHVPSSRGWSVSLCQYSCCFWNRIVDSSRSWTCPQLRCTRAQAGAWVTAPERENFCINVIDRNLASVRPDAGKRRKGVSHVNKVGKIPWRARRQNNDAPRAVSKVLQGQISSSHGPRSAGPDRETDPESRPCKK